MGASSNQYGKFGVIKVEDFFSKNQNSWHGQWRSKKRTLTQWARCSRGIFSSSMSRTTTQRRCPPRSITICKRGIKRWPPRDTRKRTRRRRKRNLRKRKRKRKRKKRKRKRTRK